ncbi:DUF4838 domain-containing protein [Nitrococcus mobilis]|uniref:Beta-hexosaminidase bacterial type N-terminal domain-containing protein n=1 Tax=Nitrococcus mobilis Nb-231 TaxID=314278 RepID=A4BNF0_9GAMM|nr:DUF4838 domain-containing protein [Nitrococcus mobilis]EAR22749.1 hypothetical protein NB231_09863 [Nitrococcus mobilis Nb-231]
MNGKSSSKTIPYAVGRRHPRAGLAALTSIAVLIMLPILTARAADAILAREGHTAYRIAPATEGTPLTEHAAAELASYLRRVTGAQFAISSADSGGPAIKLSTEASSELSREGFRIRSAGRDIHITGGSARGLLYGVYAFLEDYVGVHWYGPDYTHIPQRPSLTVPAIARTEAPAFAYREVFVREADKPEYSAHNRLNGRFGHRLVRAMGQYPEAFVPLRMLPIFKLIPRKKYAKSHPEYYGGGQLRFAEPEVRRIALEALRKKLERWSHADAQPYYLLIEPADRNTYYRGGTDGELIARHGSPGAAYVDFVRRLAEQVASDYPNVTLLALAYQWSRKPPRDMTLPNNMGVMFSDIERDFAQPLQASNNRAVRTDLKGWNTLTGQILVWTYITNFGGYLQPYPDLRALTQDVPRLAREPAITGLFAQGAYNTTGGEFSVLRAWVLAHLLWDPGQDPEQLIQSFLEGYYGVAAPHIAAYIRLLHDSAAQIGVRLSVKMPPTAAYLTPPLLQKADRLFERAERAVTDDPTRLRHVRIARSALDYAILASPQAEGDGSSWINRTARLERLQGYLRLSGMRAYREGGGASPKRLLEALSIARNAPQPPAVCQNTPADDCRSVQELTLDLAGGARMVPDQAASDGAAVTMKGDKRVWGIQLPLDRLLPDSGRWRVYIAARVAADGHARVLLRTGIYPGKRRSVTVEDLAGEGYRLIELPGLWQRGAGRYLWVAPPGAKSVQAIYVDRIIAVRADDS